MSHIITAVAGKATGEGPSSHQPGVSPPLSPKNVRDEEIELTAPKAALPRPPSTATDRHLREQSVGGDAFTAAGWSEISRIPSVSYAGITPGSEEGDP